MGWKWLSKIPVIVKWLDKAVRKWAEMRTAQEELIKTKEEKGTLERMLLKVVQEKYNAEEKLSQESSRIAREAVRRAVQISFEVIKENYYLVPKKPMSFQDALLLGNPNTVLGQISPPPPPPENKDLKNADT